jgi:hypothetical protein
MAQEPSGHEAKKIKKRNRIRNGEFFFNVIGILGPSSS